MANFFSSLVPSFLREETYTPRVTLDNIVIPASEEQQGVIAIPASSNLFSGSPIVDTEENVPYPPDLPEKKLTDDTMTVPLSDNFIPGTSKSAPVDDTGYEDMSSYVPSYIVTEEGVPVPPPLLSGTAQGGDGLSVGANIQDPVKPVPPSFRQETPLTGQADTGFNWRGVLDRVLSSMDDPEVNKKTKQYASNVDQWVQGFGMSPFLALSDPESAVHRLRQQAMANAELAAKRKGTAAPSADVQFLDYLQGRGYSLKKALGVLGENKRRSATQVNVGRGENAFQERYYSNIADSFADDYEAYKNRGALTPYLETVVSYLEEYPDEYLGMPLSDLYQKGTMLYNYLAGIPDQKKEEFLTALDTISNQLRADNLKAVTGGQGVNEYEQKLLGKMTPGPDKTVAQNLYIAKSYKRIKDKLDARAVQIFNMIADGAPVSDVLKEVARMQDEDRSTFEGIEKGYKALPKNENDVSTGQPRKQGTYRVIRRID